MNAKTEKFGVKNLILIGGVSFQCTLAVPA